MVAAQVVKFEGCGCNPGLYKDYYIYCEGPYKPGESRKEAADWGDFNSPRYPYKCGIMCNCGCGQVSYCELCAKRLGIAW